MTFSALGFDLAHFFGDWSQSESLSEIKPPLVKKTCLCRYGLFCMSVIPLCKILDNFLSWRLFQLGVVRRVSPELCQFHSALLCICTYLQSTCFHLTIFFLHFFLLSWSILYSFTTQALTRSEKKEDFFVQISQVTTCTMAFFLIHYKIGKIKLGISLYFS